MRVSPLRVAALVEAVSLGVLLVNLVTVRFGSVASVCGPVHGCAYVITVVLAFSGGVARSRWLSLVPGVGGLLVGRAG